MDSRGDFGEPIGVGATARVYRRGDRAVKVYTGGPEGEAHREAERQAFAHGVGLPTPRVYGVYPVEGGVALETEYVDGEELSALILSGRLPPSEALDKMAALQCEVFRADGAGQQGQLDWFAWTMHRGPYLSAREADAAEATMRGLDRGAARLCHGDFHPKNILVDRGGGWWIIDWVNMACGEPLADAARSLLVFLQHFPEAAGLYLDAVCGHMRASRGEVEAWLPVAAAVRLGDGAGEGEVDMLRGIIAGRW